MSKMKHLLRKLHIGGGLNEDHRLVEETQPITSPSSIPSSNQSSSSYSASAVDRPAGDSGSGDAVDFSFLEEEFQVQLALAISASDPDTREDPESAQIDAAKKMSLGCPNSVMDTEALVELLSLRYWSYNVVNYDEKVMDGFYDVYGITSSSVPQGKMPLLVDLQAIPVLYNVDYEVILVNRLVDPELQQLEKRACTIYSECQVTEQGPIASGLIQKIADMVAHKMGGSVGDADEMLKRWSSRSYELRSSLNNIILPIGLLDVGLSRHRALLFKVLADKINLPCMLVKGSYYTGTDEGAVNLIKAGDGSEYIIDLMGAPGALIPAEVPSFHFSYSGSGVRSFANVTETPGVSSLIADEGIGSVAVPPICDRVSKVDISCPEAALMGVQTGENGRDIIERTQMDKFEIEFGQLLAPLCKSCEGPSDTSGKASPAQKMKVKNVSKYVISAAKNPDFAQKLHAVLSESGASPPPNLFLDRTLQYPDEQKVLEEFHLVKGKGNNAGAQCYPDEFFSNHDYLPSAGVQCIRSFDYNNEQKQCTEGSTEKHEVLETYSQNSNFSLAYDTTSDEFVLVRRGSNEPTRTDAKAIEPVPVNPPVTIAMGLYEDSIYESSLPPAAVFHQRHLKSDITRDGTQRFQDNTGGFLNKYDLSNKSTENLMRTANVSYAHNERVSSMLSEVAEWEIPWEDLQIGERIGIGSYGEVYHADLNGTEVAVKKFLNQDFSGDALVQFKCEVEIMLRLRHPNVVLFMGAVTRSPHFSILTEFLPRGSLYGLLHRPNPPVDENRRIRMALDVAKGMNYLHTSHPTIVHRDLKSPNLLVDKNWVVKVCDFGLSRVQHHTFLSSKSTAGTPEWMAPEVLRNELANEKCDVYSFGVILWELATLHIPWRGLNPMQVVGAVGFQDKRLEIPADVDPAVAQIINECWQTESHLRPSFSQLVSRLRRLQHLVVKRTDSAILKTDRTEYGVHRL